MTGAVVLVGALAALLGLWLRRIRPACVVVAVAAGTSALGLTVAAWWVEAPTRRAALPWGPLPTGGLDVPFAVGADPGTDAVAAVVALVALAVQVYAVWYLADDDRYAVFAATVSLFTAAMLLVVYSRDLLLTLVGWEVMGWCSFLLIGHWSRRATARRAAVKALLVVRVADVAVVLAFVGLAVGAGSTGHDAVLAHWAGPGAELVSSGGPGSGADPVLRSVLVVLLAVGVLGKSAQLPFQDWLPDAMEGPTPASALIHAATMVAAGTVVLAQFFALLAATDAARWVLAGSVSVTMVLAALLAFAQPDLKRLLAWSTVSQVAVMLSALAGAPAADGPGAGLFHLWSHALFKSLLFLALGWLAVVGGGTLARRLRGSAAVQPLAGAGFLVGLLSLGGVPLLVGGVSKEHVLATAFTGATGAGATGVGATGAGSPGPAVLVLVALLVTVAATAAYATRAFLVVTTAPEGGAVQRRTPFAPAAVRAVLTLLLLLTLVGGVVALTGAFDLPAASLWWTVVTMLLLAVGVGTGAWASRAGDPVERLSPAVLTLAQSGVGADPAYRVLVLRPVLGAARLAAYLDREVVDGYVSGSAAGARLAGLLGDRAHRGERPSAGLALVAAGLVALALLGVVAWS